MKVIPKELKQSDKIIIDKSIWIIDSIIIYQRDVEVFLHCGIKTKRLLLNSNEVLDVKGR